LKEEKAATPVLIYEPAALLCKLMMMPRPAYIRPKARRANCEVATLKNNRPPTPVGHSLLLDGSIYDLGRLLNRHFCHWRLYTTRASAAW
jgi:hypothetical protein